MLSLLLLWLFLSLLASLLFWAACVVAKRTDKGLGDE